jgi:hypothetical protein
LWPSLPVDDYSDIPGNSGETGCVARDNYYCLDYKQPRCCWLNGILDPNQPDAYNARQGQAYFAAMSTAFAQTCTGTVYVALDNPADITVQYAGHDPSIWLSHELPTLQKRYPQYVTGLKTLRVSGGRVIDTPLTAQDATQVLANQNTPKKRNELDDEIVYKMARDLKEARRRSLKQAKSMDANATNLLHKRAGCAMASNWENLNLDYFG